MSHKMQANWSLTPFYTFFSHIPSLLRQLFALFLTQILDELILDIVIFPFDWYVPIFSFLLGSWRSIYMVFGAAFVSTLFIIATCH